MYPKIMCFYNGSVPPATLVTPACEMSTQKKRKEKILMRKTVYFWEVARKWYKFFLF